MAPSGTVAQQVPVVVSPPGPRRRQDNWGQMKISYFLLWSNKGQILAADFCVGCGFGSGSRCHLGLGVFTKTLQFFASVLLKPGISNSSCCLLLLPIHVKCESLEREKKNEGLIFGSIIHKVMSAVSLCIDWDSGGTA